jgi:glycosyltransferase involved in cell wall biosynthesis
MPLITILIPTYNRPKRIEELLRSFINYKNEWPGDTWEILISENCKAEESQLAGLVSKFDTQLPLRIANPPEHLISGEENLFFGWQFATGKYVWILGDDDPINFFEIDELVQRCHEEQSKVFKFNSIIISNNGETTGEVVTKCSASEIAMPFLEFIQKVGMWHTAAGFSTWVINRDLLDGKEGSDWIKKFRSPVYSHVTYFMYKLHREECLFINKNLVSYRMNAYAENKADHWGRYTAQANMPRNFPWTLGFVEQLLELEANGIISREYWGSVIGDHFEVPRFLEFNSMVNLALIQLNNHSSRNLDLNLEEWKKLVNYFSSIRPDIYDFWFEFLEIIEMKFVHKTNKRDQRALGKKSKALHLNWLNRMTAHPFEAFKKLSINGWDLYSFPDSNFTVPENDLLLLNRAVELVAPKHQFIRLGASYDELLEDVSQLDSPELCKVSPHESVDFFNHLARRIKTSGIRLPKAVKNFGKKFLR